jgi:NAD(P)-dependent dehydrogenase (short-subunit alcohol dehydrogenase family)
MPSHVFRDGLLNGKVALVTGGGTGIGAAIARELGHLGATVVIASRKPEVLNQAAAALSADVGATVHPEIVDIRDRDAVRALFSRLIERFGRIDILVNNGGGQFLSPAEEIKDRGWDAVIQTNLTGTWNMTRAAADAWMLANGGRIINITMLTRRGWPGMAHSVSARAGVEALTRSLAVEWAPRGIRINCIEPGIVASNGARNYPLGTEWFRGIQSMIPAKRLGTCAEIAWMTAFLAGPAGDYATGQTFVIDGGKDLWGDLWPVPDPESLPELKLASFPWEDA